MISEEAVYRIRPDSKTDRQPIPRPHPVPTPGTTTAIRFSVPRLIERPDHRWSRVYPRTVVPAEEILLWDKKVFVNFSL